MKEHAILVLKFEDGQAWIVDRAQAGVRVLVPEKCLEIAELQLLELGFQVHQSIGGCAGFSPDRTDRLVEQVGIVAVVGPDLLAVENRPGHINAVLLQLGAPPIPLVEPPFIEFAGEEPDQFVHTGCCRTMFTPLLRR